MRLWLVVFALVGCSRTVVDELDGADGGFPLARCVAGKVEGCPCLGQVASGVQTCLADGTFGACQCPTTGCTAGQTVPCQCPLGDLGSRECNSAVCLGCRSAPNPDADGGGGMGRVDDGGVVLSAGTDTLVDLFPVNGGLIVVRSTVVQLLDGTGRELKAVNSPREITAAAFDGTLLGVADRALLIVFDQHLNLLRSVNLVDTCASGVVLSGGRFICGPTYDWDRIFTVLDMNTGVVLRRGPEKFTYHGLPMRRVPGRDDFVTVSGLSPSDFFLYRLDNPSMEVRYLGESPYHGAFAATTVFAFDRTPASRIITSEGVILDIYPQGCETGTGQGCFVRAGNLGTLPNGRAFLAMTESGDGFIYGIVNVSMGSYFDPKCEMGCEVQRIDFDQRVVRAQVNWMARVDRIVAIAYDSFQHRLVVGYLVSTGNGMAGGYQITSFNL